MLDQELGLHQRGDMNTERTEWHELCATFSVRDHLHAGAFIPEVLLYDRLIIPVPPKAGLDGVSLGEAAAEQQRWIAKGWQPEKQEQLLATLLTILPDRVLTVPWTKQLRDEWTAAMDAHAGTEESVAAPADRLFKQAREDGYFETGSVLQQFAPEMSRVVVAVSPYRSLEDLVAATPIRPLRPATQVASSSLMAVLGFELLVPDDAVGSPEEQLRQAARIAAREDYRERRTALYLWQQKFIAQGHTDATSIRGAIDEMKRLVEGIQAGSKWKKAKRVLSFFHDASSIVGASHPLAEKLGGALISMGEYGCDRQLEKRPSSAFGTPAASLILDAQKRMQQSPHDSW